MKHPVFYLLLLSLLAFSNCDHGNNHEDERVEKRYDHSRLSRITEFQKRLIEEGITGSNIAMVYKDGEIIYREVVNSGKDGDANITDKTIFPIWSMSKPITTVAAMILYEEGKTHP